MEENKKVKNPPLWKMILDDYMLLLFIGVAIYAIFYLIWGVMEIGNVPLMPDEIKNSLIK
ncbi:MAG: hypothetical protein AB1458_02145 [Bacteroidota bacterium]